MKGRKLRVFLAAIVAIAFALVPCLAFADGEPTATVTKQSPRQDAPLNSSYDGNGDVLGTVALDCQYKFVANQPTEAQLAQYGNWNCDYTVSFNKAIEANSFGLYGEYGDDGYAFYFPVALEANTPFFLLKNAFNDKLSYNTLLNSVGTFTCGAFNSSAANVGTEMTVALVMWPGDNTDQAITINETKYTFAAAPQPTATVDDTLPAATDVPIYVGTIGSMANTGATVASVDQYEFATVEPGKNTLDYYGDWDIDYEVTFDRDIPANTIGLYGAYTKATTDEDFKVGYRVADAIPANTPVKLLSALGDTLSYRMLLAAVPTFDCGAFNLSPVNNGATMTVKLVMWDENDNRIVLDERSYTFDGYTTIDPTPMATITQVGSVEAAPVYVGTDFSDASKLGTVAVNDVYNFVPDANSGNDTAAYNAYKDWYADFVVTFDNDVAAESMGLYGKYGTYGEVALLLPEVNANEGIWLLSTAFGLDSQLTYDEVVNVVQSFDCGAFNLSDANKNTKMDVQLVLYQRDAEGNVINEIECGSVTNHVIGDAGVWTVNGVDYRYVADGLDENGMVLVDGALVAQAEAGPHFASTPLAEYGYSIKLEDSIDIIYNVKNLTDNPANYSITYTFGGETETKTLTSKSFNSFTIAKCAAKQMADEVTVVVKHGDDVIKEAKYSIKSYCDYVIDKDGKVNQSMSDNQAAALCNLCKATLDYGRYAQERFDYNTENLANGGTDSFNIAGIGILESDAATSGECTGITGQSLSLSVESWTRFEILLKHDEGASLEDYSFTLDGDPVDNENVTDRNNKFEIWVNGIAAQNLRGTHTVTVTNTTDNTSYTYTASPVRYMNLAVTAAPNSKDAMVCRALYNYHTAAVEYLR